MQLYRALILFVTLSTACGLSCYLCPAAHPKSCTGTTTCPGFMNRCFTLKLDGDDMVMRGCQNSITCVGAMDCCEGNLCNSGILPVSSVILLLASSASLALFL